MDSGSVLGVSDMRTTFLDDISTAEDSRNTEACCCARRCDSTAGASDANEARA